MGIKAIYSIYSKTGIKSSRQSSWLMVRKFQVRQSLKFLRPMLILSPHSLYFFKMTNPLRHYDDKQSKTSQLPQQSWNIFFSSSALAFYKSFWRNPGYHYTCVRDALNHRKKNPNSRDTPLIKHLWKQKSTNKIDLICNRKWQVFDIPQGWSYRSPCNNK